MTLRQHWATLATVCIASIALSGCASPEPESAQQSVDSSMTAESANAEQLDLIDALQAAVRGSWGKATVNRFRTCTTASGEAGVQITREVRGSGIADSPAAARAFRDTLTDHGFDAEIRRSTEVVGTATANRFAAFNSDRGASILQAYSACYPFDLDSAAPTVPATTGD